MTTDRRLISIVSPVFNEEACLPAFHARVVEMWSQISMYDLELIYVDDGSSDGSADILRSIAASDARVRVLRMSRNFGHQAAITCGIDHALGAAVVVIDSDLQDPPEVIPQMVEVWERGVDVVFGQRRVREGEHLLKRMTAAGYYRLLARLTDLHMPVDSGDFRLLSRRSVDALKQLREESRYVRGLIAWVGFQQEAVVYDRDPRFAGDSSYSWGRMFRLALDGVTSFSDRPLRLATSLGVMVSGGSFIGAVYITLSKLMKPEQSLPGFASLSVLILFLGGVQLTSIGVLGEYVGRVFKETKRRPLYLVMEKIEPGHPGS